MTDEQRKLIEDNHKLIYSFLLMYGLDIEEFYDLAAIGMCKAAITFDASVGAFSTYAYSFMKTEMRNEQRKLRNSRHIPEHLISSYNSEIETGHNSDNCTVIDILPSNDNVESEVIQKISIEKYMGSLPEKYRQIAELLSLGYTQKEIANIMGCEHQNISMKKNRIRKRLEKYMKEVKR